ncbi:MAG: zinc dependent phospholipase C family protein [Clostridia bacterium]|nr:zinc dependent phospholipase C family protein [Clostridia bacterium]
MRTLTHYRFAKVLLPLLPPDNLLQRAFLIGCVAPDVNLFSHIDIAKHKKLPHLHGHNHPHLDKRINRMAKKLASHHTKMTPLYAFRLGVLLHYLADAFTFAHNLDFSGDFEAHNAYENAFHRYFEKRLAHLPQNFWKKTTPFSYKKLRRRYLNEKPSFARDFCFILLAARGALNAFLPVIE